MKCPKCNASFDQLDSGKCPLCGGAITHVIPIPKMIPLKRADSPKSASNFRFVSCTQNNTEGYTLCGFDGKMEKEVTVPETYNGKPVLSVRKAAFRGNKYLESIQLPNSLQVIEESAFECCTNLSNVDFYGNNLSLIRENAFRGCISLSPQSSIFKARFAAAASAFAGCYQLPVIPFDL